MINFEQYNVLTFDCYGTLIDWETGILTALKPILAAHRVNETDDNILKLYAEFEPAQQQTYIKYRDVLAGVVKKFGEHFGFNPTPTEKDSLADSIQNWLPFPDTVEALKSLKKRYKLAVISNIDNDLFALSAKRLEVEFDWVITAEEVRSYKPSLNNFKLAFAKINLPLEQILHVAASVYHDIIPARSLGLATVWVNRTSHATLPESKPDLEVPDLQTLAAIISL